MDTGTNWGDWFDRINTAAITWYGVYQGQQPATTNPTATITPLRTGGLSASISPAMLFLGAAVIIGAVYVYKKA